MGIVSDIERLINEHGSAAILRERIQLFADKYAALERENGVLKSRVEECEAQLKESAEEIARLQEIVVASAKDKGVAKLEDVEKKILQFLFDTNKDFTTKQIAAQMGIAEGFAQHYLDSLSKKGLLGGSISFGGPSTYDISAEGRSLIIKSS